MRDLGKISGRSVEDLWKISGRSVEDLWKICGKVFRREEERL